MTIAIKCSAIKTEAYSIHTDHLGTPKAITNQNQETVWSIEMDTFGETKQIQAKTITDPNTNTQRPFEFNLRFAGQYFDQESGYHYNYHRYYDPKIGRYLTSDPIGLAGGLNSYGYANSEPWGAVDWLGLDALYVTYPDYEASAFGRRWGGTGHSAVVIIDSTGLTKYYEYGRYDKPEKEIIFKKSKGIVVKRTVPNVVIGSDGRATAESLAKLLKAMSNLPNANRRYGRVTVDYHDKADDIQSMFNYVKFREEENTNPNRRPYGEYGYNCDSFARTTVMMGYEGWAKTGKVLDRIFDVSPDRPAGNPAKEMSYDPQTKIFTWGDKTIVLK